ncbi:MAG TPA: hypothetical protein VIV60_37550 [Polyangiaceae bacterium]
MAQPPNTLTTPEPGLARFWEFVRGDLEARDFERWCYDEDAEENILGPTFQALLNDTDFRDVVAIDNLRVGLRVRFALAQTRSASVSASATLGLLPWERTPRHLGVDSRGRRTRGSSLVALGREV